MLLPESLPNSRKDASASMTQNFIHYMEAQELRKWLIEDSQRFAASGGRNAEHFQEDIRERTKQALKRQYEAMIESLNAALNGDTEAAGQAAFRAESEYCGAVCVLLYLLDVPAPALAAALGESWSMWHRSLVQNARTRQRLRAMFRKARFPLPEHLPETVRIYRGTSYLPIRIAAKGYAWTIDRDTACFFAMRFAEKNGNPLVLAADVPRASILHYSNGRDESEAVCFDVDAPAKDGTAADWLQGYHRYTRNGKATLEADLKTISRIRLSK